MTVHDSQANGEDLDHIDRGQACEADDFDLVRGKTGQAITRAQLNAPRTVTSSHASLRFLQCLQRAINANTELRVRTSRHQDRQDRVVRADIDKHARRLRHIRRKRVEPRRRAKLAGDRAKL